MENHEKNRAVFLDKDGTLVENVPYNVDPACIKLARGVVQGLCMLQEAGYRLIVVSNQSGVARGYFTEDALQQAYEHLRRRLCQAGIVLEEFYYCPHHPEGCVAEYAVECDCRKPRPALIVQAAYEHDINLGHSWLVGDILNDVEAGQRAGCRTVLVDSGGETQWSLGPYRWPHHIVDDMSEAARAILNAPPAPQAQ